MPKIIIYMLAFWFCACQCQNEEMVDIPIQSGSRNDVINISSDEYNSIAFDDLQELDVSEIYTLLSTYVGDIRDFASSNATRNYFVEEPTNLKVLNSYYIGEKTDRAQSLLYDLEFKNAGLLGRAIISADKKAPKVIAYLPSYGDSLEKEVKSRG